MPFFVLHLTCNAMTYTPPQSLSQALARALLRAFLALFVFCSWAMPAHAADAPDISPVLKKVLAALPVDQAKGDVQGMMQALRKTECGGGLKGCYMTKSGSTQLYFYASNNTQQTLLLVVNEKVSMPKLLKANVQGLLGGTSMQDMIVSVSTSDFDLDASRMPPDLRQIVRNSYFDVPRLSFASGVQFTARADLKGALRIALDSIGLRVDKMTMRGGVAMPIPADLMDGAGSGAGAAASVAQGETMKKSLSDALSPEAYIELQFAPGASIDIAVPKMKLTEATVFLNNALTLGYNGYVSFDGTSADLRSLMQFQTPLTPAGVMDFADFSFYFASPARMTLSDAARMLIAMAAPDPRLTRYGGGFVRNIESFKQPLLAATQPLSVIQVKNTVPPADYKFGDPSKPFPSDPKYFNIVILGPLAQGGPLMKYAGGATILGQTFGATNVIADAKGFNGSVANNINIKLGPLGRLPIKMAAEAVVDKGTQRVRLKGDVAGQHIEVTLDGATLAIDVNATCVNPFEIKAKVAFTPTTNIADVFEGQGGASVDPAKIPNCVGKALEDAYNKIAKEYQNLGGFSATEANKALKKIADDAAAAAAQAAQAAKERARELANKSTSEGKKAFNSAGNAIGKGATNVVVKATGGGVSKAHTPSEAELMFHRTVFDWDYYYDTRGTAWGDTDLFDYWMKTGYAKGERASNEFWLPDYRKRYSVKGSNYEVLLDWYVYYQFEGRQGSPTFSLQAYKQRYPDLKNFKLLDLMNHWLDHGRYEGRNGRP
jgi:hypothetical protein